MSCFDRYGIGFVLDFHLKCSIVAPAFCEDPSHSACDQVKLDPTAGLILTDESGKPQILGLTVSVLMIIRPAVNYVPVFPVEDGGLSGVWQLLRDIHNEACDVICL